MNEHNFFVGKYGPSQQQSFPIVAYHPSMISSTVEQERQRLTHLYLRGDQECPVASVKLWGRYDGECLNLDLRKFHPLDLEIPGEPIACGQVRIPFADFERWLRDVEANGGLAVTLLDDDLAPRTDCLIYLVERFQVEG